MVEYEAVLDRTFGSLANASRRDMLRRVAGGQNPAAEFSARCDLTIAAASQPPNGLRKAALMRLAPEALVPATTYLEQYKELWEDRLDSLERYLKTLQ